MFSHPCVISVIADINQGKSMVLYHLITQLRKNHDFNLYSYGLKSNMGEQKINSVEELESIENSIIILDEFMNLLEVDNRKKRKIIERTLRLINHNNNILILCGLPENMKKFLSAKVEITIYKRCTLADFINGSKAKELCLSYRGDELGSALLNLPINEMLIFDGKHYSKEKVPYYKEHDSKKDNESILKKCSPKRSTSVSTKVLKKINKEE